MLTQRESSSFIYNIIDETKRFFKPEDVFDEEALEQWAKDKGYKKEE